jgi:lipopolysaccharide assembly outer membrane protein LptD (OstA)
MLRSLVPAATIAFVLCIRPALAVPIIKVSAERLMFYNDGFVVLGNGNVRVDLGSGRVVTGDYFAIDLRVNRFLVAGSVRVRSERTEFDGSAFSDDFDTQNRSYSQWTQSPIA